MIGQIAGLKFLPNDPSHKQSKFISTYRGGIVFADPQLEAEIELHNLIGQTLEVEVTPIGSSKPIHLARIPSSNSTGLCIQQAQITSMENLFLVDCQNMVGALGNIGSGLDIYELIQKVAAKLAHFPKQIICYISEDDVKGPRIVSLRRHLTEVDLVITPTKTINGSHNQQIVKRDVDPFMLPEIVRRSFSPDSAQCLVVFGGDSDLCESLSMWIGVPGYNQYAIARQRPLILVSSHQGRTLSLELRELANNPNVHLLLIEDL